MFFPTPKVKAVSTRQTTKLLSRLVVLDAVSAGIVMVFWIPGDVFEPVLRTECQSLCWNSWSFWFLVTFVRCCVCVRRILVGVIVKWYGNEPMGGCSWEIIVEPCVWIEQVCSNLPGVAIASG